MFINFNNNSNQFSLHTFGMVKMYTIEFFFTAKVHFGHHCIKKHWCSDVKTSKTSMEANIDVCPPLVCI